MRLRNVLDGRERDAKLGLRSIRFRHGDRLQLCKDQRTHPVASALAQSSIPLAFAIPVMAVRS